MKMKKKLAILVAAAMLVTSMPFYVFADDTAAAGGTTDPSQEIAVDGGTEGGETGETGEITTGAEGGEEGSGTEVNPGEGTDTGEGTEPGGEGGEGTEPGGEEPGTDEPVVEYPCWNEDHTVYYDENGQALAGVVKKIDGKLYYFNNNGVVDMTAGWKKTSAGKYCVKSGKILTAPAKVKYTRKVTYYYNKSTKKWQTKKIKGAKTKVKSVTPNYVYMFRTNGLLKKTKGLFKYNGKEYYGYGTGRLRTGWVAYVEKKSAKASYFSKTSGYMFKNRKQGYLKIPKNGRLGKAYYLGIKRLNSIGWSLRKAYNWSARMRYQGRSYRAGSSETYAIKGFSKGYGNCYCMAATFYIMAKLLGYDVHQVEGKVDLPHSWTVIRQDGREWVYDPNFTNETGRNGWKIYYGKKGTWRYNHYHKMN